MFIVHLNFLDSNTIHNIIEVTVYLRTHFNLQQHTSCMRIIKNKNKIPLLDAVIHRY